MKNLKYMVRIICAILLLFTGYFSFGQCSSTAVASASCSGTAMANGGSYPNIYSGTTYYYSGAGGSISIGSLYSGGTIMICGSVTISSFSNFYGGNLIIEPGGSLTIGTGASNVSVTLSGSGALVNYGTFTINGNLTLNNSAAYIYNQTSSLGFTVAGAANGLTIQGGYFINNANNSIVTTPKLTLNGGYICMGNFSIVNAVNVSSSGNFVTYSGTISPGCIGVTGVANLTGSTFTSSSLINVCMATGATKTGTGSWGSANVSTNCQGCNIVLPLNITNFNTVDQGNKIKLSWVSENVIGNEIFDVEESDDGINFHSIAVINAAQNQSAYTAYDNNISNTIQYYRIKEIQYGKNMYSNIQLVRTGFEQNLIIYPNPVRADNAINILFNSAKAENAFLSLIDISGKLLQTKSSSLITGKNQLQLNFKNVPAGIYILKIQTASKGNFYSSISVVNVAE